MDYETAKIAIDPVIMTVHEGKLKALLHKREKEPFDGQLELPGGLLKTDETAEQALKRKLRELIGRDDLYLKQFHTFSEVNRDPRSRAVSIGYVALIQSGYVKDLVSWYDVNSLNSLAFDHKNILLTAREYLKTHIDLELVRHFLPTEFALNKLQEIYELLENKKYDNRNFRKKMLSSLAIEETDKLETNVSHRPAKLFKFS